MNRLPVNAKQTEPCDTWLILNTEYCWIFPVRHQGHTRMKSIGSHVTSHTSSRKCYQLYLNLIYQMHVRHWNGAIFTSRLRLMHGQGIVLFWKKNVSQYFTYVRNQNKWIQYDIFQELDRNVYVQARVHLHQ